MADIRRYPIFSHLRADTTAYVQHLRNGTVRHSGAGLAFWFRPGTAALSEVPLDDRQQALLFHARTADFPVSYTHLRAHETPEHLVCRLLLEKKNLTYDHPTI